ncbi:MAG: LamG-like jellyroll fold domain-containing protein [Verrucomicrobiales bacterium]
MNQREGQLEVMRRCLDGGATGEEFAQLEDWLRKDEEFRKTYLRYLNVDLALAALPKPAVQEPPQAAPKQDLGRWPIRGLAGWAAAAVALLLLTGILVDQVIDGRRIETSPGGPDNVAGTVDVNDNGVAVLTRVAGLQGEATGDLRAGQTIPPGLLEWDAGLLQLEFYGGATLVVEGPAEIEVLDESRVVCRLGRLRAHVPDQARGFAVLAPSFELVDLGTEFGLDIEGDGAAEIHVFDGKVELYEADSNRSQSSRRELNAGDALTVDRDGTSKPTAVRDADFITPTGLSQLTDARRQAQLRDWRAFRQSLQDDPRVVAYFPFDRSDTQDRLLTGYGTDGTSLAGAIVGCEWSEGRWPDKQSLQFKRPGDRVRIEIPGEFESVTYSTWLRVDGLDRKQNSILLTDGFGKNGLHWQIRQNGELVLGMRYAKDRSYNYHTDAIFNLFRLGQWVHLATVYDSGQARVTHYVNGALAKREPLRQAADGLLKIGKATIGNWSIPTSRYRGSSVRNFNGCIDELIVFGGALDDQEVQRIYEIGRP